MGGEEGGREPTEPWTFKNCGRGSRTRGYWYGETRDANQPWVVICEGARDTWVASYALHAAGLDDHYVVFGVHTAYQRPTERMVESLAGRLAGRPAWRPAWGAVLILLDGDNAGYAAAWRLREGLVELGHRQAHVRRIDVIRMNPGMDVCDLAAGEGLDAVVQLIEEASGRWP